MKIESIGYYLPPSSSIENLIQKLPEGMQYPIHEKTGIKYFRKAKNGEYSLSLSLKAAERCLSLSKHLPESIDAIICCNICKHDSANELTLEPSTAATVAKKLGIETVNCFDINNACAGLFTGLYTAQSMIANDPTKKILLISGEFITKLGETVLKESKINSEYDFREMIACLTLGDSAVAMVVEYSKDGKGFSKIDLQTHGEYSDLCKGYPTKNGPLMLTKSRELANRASKLSADHTVQYLSEYDQNDLNIQYVIPHQTAEKVIRKGTSLVNAKQGTTVFDEANTVINLKHRGNTSTTTHFVALMDRMLSGDINKGNKIMFSISASGITVGTALYKMDDLPERIRIGENQSKEELEIATPKETKPLFINSVATLPKDYNDKIETFSMLKPVVLKALRDAKLNGEKIGLIVFSGVYKTNNISEPAIAAMVLKEIGLSESDQKTYFSDQLFSFDISNGSLGLQKAMESVNELMQYRDIEHALVVTAEVSQAALIALNDFPIESSASAMVLSKKETDSELKMTDSKTYNYWAFSKDYESVIGWDDKELDLRISKGNQLDQKYVLIIIAALDKFFKSTGKSFDDFDHIAFPTISTEFKTVLFDHFDYLITEKMINHSIESDLFTSQVPNDLYQMKLKAQSGDTMLQIQVASGLQVNISTWKFK